jgi:hypothetical protein
MIDTSPPTDLQLLTPEQLALGVRTRLKAMAEADASKVDIAMAIGDLANEAADLVGHGRYGKWIKAAGLTLRTAFDYRYLASNRARVNAFRQRAADLKKSFSIRSVLKELCPRSKPKQPKRFTEIEDAERLGTFLEGHRDLFWQALQFAPERKAEIAQRRLPETATAVEALKSPSKPAADSAAEARAIRELLRHPTSSNIETARTKASHITRLLDPGPAPKPAAVKQVNLDHDALDKALGFDRPDLPPAESTGTTLH